MWELEITEGEGYEKTFARVYEDGATFIRQEVECGSGRDERVDLSPEQMKKIIRRFCSLTGFDPNSY